MTWIEQWENWSLCFVFICSCNFEDWIEEKGIQIVFKTRCSDSDKQILVIEGTNDRPFCSLKNCGSATKKGTRLLWTLDLGLRMARGSRSVTSSKWRYCHPSYYLKRPKRLALLFIGFVCVSFVVWDRQTLVREHQVLAFRFRSCYFSIIFYDGRLEFVYSKEIYLGQCHKMDCLMGEGSSYL